MYSNVNNTYENFQSNDMLKKKEYSDLLDHFVDYYEKLTELNKPYGDLLTQITKNKTEAIEDLTPINLLIKNLLDSGDKIKHLSTELSYNLNKIVMINKKYYDLLEEKVIIIDCTTTQTTQTTNTKTSDSINVNLYKKKTGNDKKKYDLKTLEKTIIKVKSLINKIEFDPSYKDKLNTLFTNYLSITKNLYKIDIIDTLSKPCDKNEIEKIITLLSKNNTLIGAENPIIVDLNRIKLLPEDKQADKINKLKKKFIIYGDKRNYFERTKHKMNLEARLCEKLKKLDKPDKNNLILKRFTDDLLEKKNKYVSQLESKIKNIQTLMTDKELADYETYMYRTNDQAKKQFNAIKQGIDNIKNNNKVKINLT